MCPACLAAAVLITAKVSSAGTLAALVTKRFSIKDRRDTPSQRNLTSPARGAFFIRRVKANGPILRRMTGVTYETCRFDPCGT